MFPGPVNVFWSSYNEIRSSEADVRDRWQPFQLFSGEFVTCFLVLVLVQKCAMSFTPMPATQITMKFPPIAMAVTQISPNFKVTPPASQKAPLEWQL